MSRKRRPQPDAGLSGSLPVPGIAILAALLVFFACTGERPDREEATTLYGRWAWVMATGPGGFHMSPESEGYRLEYVFRPDGQLEIYRDRTLAARTRYAIEWQHPREIEDSIPVLQLQDSTIYTGRRQIIRRLSADTLVLQSPYLDTPLVYFERAARPPGRDR